MQRLRFCNLESQCKSRFDPTASNEMHFITKFHNYHQPFSLNVLNESIQTESWLDERSNNWATLWVNGSTSFFLRNLHLSNFLLFWQLEKRKNFCRFKKKMIRGSIDHKWHRHLQLKKVKNRDEWKNKHCSWSKIFSARDTFHWKYQTSNSTSMCVFTTCIECIIVKNLMSNKLDYVK